MKMFKKISFVLCIVSLISAMTVSAFASSVSFDKTAQKLIFTTTSQENPTDLFENFKNAMPGDVLTQEIIFSNLQANDTDAIFYLKSTGANTESQNLLSKMTLKVEADNIAVFETEADKPAALTDWVKLGTLKPGAETKVKLTLTIPIELGNEFQDAKGTINWQFKAEEVAVPQTGDSSDIYLWISLVGVAAAGIVVCLIIASKKKEK